MQTFVPYGSNFIATAKVLDMKRLGKQRVEAWQIIKALTGDQKGWRYHPATRMWEGRVDALAVYGKVMCEEWVRRGYKDSLLPRFEEYVPFVVSSILLPDWLYKEDMVTSHRSNLIRKRPDIYGPIWPGVPDNLPYLWPTPKPGGGYDLVERT